MRAALIKFMPHFPDFNSPRLCQLHLVGLKFRFCGVCGCKRMKRNYNCAFLASQMLSRTRLKRVADVSEFCAGFPMAVAGFQLSAREEEAFSVPRQW